MKSLIDYISSYLPLLVTIPFAIHTVSAGSGLQAPTPQIEPSQLIIQALYIFGAALLGWAARKLNMMNETRKENKKAHVARKGLNDRIDVLQASHAVELKIQNDRYLDIKSQLESSRALVLELNDGIETRDKALHDVIQQLREQKSNVELIRMVIEAIDTSRKDAINTAKSPDASS